MLQVIIANKVATVLLDTDLNILTQQLLTALTDEFRLFKRSPDVSAIILRGSGRAFSAGADLKEIVNLTAETGRRFSNLGIELMDAIEMAGRPVVAAIDGYALGGGLELAMACTFRIATYTSMFGLPEINYGLTTAFGTIGRLMAICGYSKTLEMCLLGRTLTAPEAYACGLITNVIKEEDLAESANQLAQRLASLPTPAVQQYLQAAHAARRAFEAGIQAENENFAKCCGSDGPKSLITEFLGRKRT